MLTYGHGGPIREANQDGEAARRVRIDLSRFESIEPPTRGFSVRVSGGSITLARNPTCKLADPKIDPIKPIQLRSHLKEVHSTIGTYETDI